jgi:hypothetical protein
MPRALRAHPGASVSGEGGSGPGGSWPGGEAVERIGVDAEVRAPAKIHSERARALPFSKREPESIGSALRGRGASTSQAQRPALLRTETPSRPGALLAAEQQLSGALTAQQHTPRPVQIPTIVHRGAVAPIGCRARTRPRAAARMRWTVAAIF